MNKIAKIAGALFLVSTGAYLIGNGLLNSVLDRPDFLAELYPDRANALAGVFLEFINALAVAGIAMLLVPILRKHNEAFAMGYYGARILEVALLILSAIVPLVLIALSDLSLSEGSAEASFYQALGEAGLEARSMLFQAAMLVLSLGSLLLCQVLYRWRLVPRWLSVIGLVGYAALLASSVMSVLGHDLGPILFAPGALFEIAFPLWLLVKGFDLRREKPVEA